MRVFHWNVLGMLQESPIVDTEHCSSTTLSSSSKDDHFDGINLLDVEVDEELGILKVIKILEKELDEEIEIQKVD